jgi:hypothetical protein
MHGVLVFTVCMIRIVEPYVSNVDTLLEIFVCLSLSCTVHIVSLWDHDDDPTFVAVFAVFFLAPLVALVVLLRNARWARPVLTCYT